MIIIFLFKCVFLGITDHVLLHYFVTVGLWRYLSPCWQFNGSICGLVQKYPDYLLSLEYGREISCISRPSVCHGHSTPRCLQKPWSYTLRPLEWFLLEPNQDLVTFNSYTFGSWYATVERALNIRLFSEEVLYTAKNSRFILFLYNLKLKKYCFVCLYDLGGCFSVSEKLTHSQKRRFWGYTLK